MQDFTHSTEKHVVGALVVFAHGEIKRVLNSLVINVNVARRADHRAQGDGDGDERREDNKACLPHLDLGRLDTEQNN